MRIICPNCGTVYELAAGAIGPKGRSVRCSKCKERWQAMPEPEDEPDAFMAAPAFDEAGEDDDFSSARDSASGEDDFVSDGDGDEDDYAAFQPQKPPVSESDPILSAVSLIEGELGRQRSAGTMTPRAREGAAKGVRLKAGITRAFDMRKSLPALVVLGLFLLVLGVFMRNAIVRVVPDLAGLYELAGLEVNVRGLIFTDISTDMRVSNGQPVLLVEGAVENIDTSAREVPAIRLAMVSAQGSEVYVWLSELQSLQIEPGSRLPFRTQVVAPPALARNLTLRFIERQTPSAAMTP